MSAEQDLRRYARDAVESAEHGSEGHVRNAVGSMTHRRFSGIPIVFHLTEWALKDIIEKVIRETTSTSFQNRVSFVEFVEA